MHLCRPEAATESDCGDGKDNDCDGYTDKEDTDCKTGPSTSRRLLVEPLLDTATSLPLSLQTMAVAAPTWLG